MCGCLYFCLQCLRPSPMLFQNLSRVLKLSRVQEVSSETAFAMLYFCKHTVLILYCLLGRLFLASAFFVHQILRWSHKVLMSCCSPSFSSLPWQGGCCCYYVEALRASLARDLIIFCGSCFLVCSILVSSYETARASQFLQ